MVALLIALIYLAFVSLGLPDSLLGSAWPVMQTQLGVPISYAGIVTITITVGTIVSSVFSNFLTKKLGAGLVTAISTAMTAVALMGFSLATKFWHLMAWAVPFGLGAGGVDAALNNYVALHYSSKHMNWLHACWGLGALISPFVMGECLKTQFGWTGGYRAISFVQIAIAGLLFLSLPLWKKSTTEQQKHNDVKTIDALRVKGILPLLTMFLAYCALEQTAMLWASSYLVKVRNIDETTAATLGSLLFIGITIGRFACGFVSNKLGDNKLIVVGSVVITVGIACIIVPIGPILCYVGLVLTGLGCAPIYPAIIHATPANFGEQNSQAIIGVQMACAYVGCALMPPLFGLISEKYMAFYPYFLAIFLVLMVVMYVILQKILKNKEKKNGQISQSI